MRRASRLLIAAMVGALVLAGPARAEFPAAMPLAKLAEAAEAGDPAAQFALAERYLDGTGVLQNHATAASWLSRAAEGGDARAQNRLGQLYHAGLGVPRDIATALVWLERAAAGGDPQFLHDFASVLESPGAGADFARAATLYARAAETGHLEATVSLGVLYQNGTGVEQDPARARALYETAARADHPRALNNLGLLYVRGDGVAQDYDRAAKLFAAAADLGLRTAMTNLGVMYENGFGVPLDEVRAAELYRRGAETAPSGADFIYDPRLAPIAAGTETLATVQAAAQAHDPVGLFQLGWLLISQPDPPFAAQQQAGALFRAAALRGHGPAMANLSLMYFRGQGVPQDYVQGQMWLLLANRAGADTTALSLAYGAKLTPEQINNAQELAFGHLETIRAVGERR